MSTPSITAAQIVAIVQAVIATLVAFGADITQAQSVAVIGLAAVVAHVLVKGDANIREARNYRAATEDSPPTNPPAGDYSAQTPVDPSTLGAHPDDVDLDHTEAQA